MPHRLHTERPVPPEHADLVADFELVGSDDDALARAQAALVGGRVWDGALMDRAPELKVLARTGIGFDAVDLAAATERGILVTNTPDGPTVPTAEHTVALLLAATKRLAESARRLRDGAGNYHAAHDALELAGRTLGLVGCGRIGHRVAVAAQALGMDVIVHDPFLTECDFELVDLPAVWARADVVSLHAPLTETTRHLVNAESLAAMKPGVVLVNAARGGLIDHDALLAALDSGQVRVAGLDVTEPEPLPGDHPLLHRDDVVVTPHIASATADGKRRMVEMAVEQIRQGLAGERPTHLVNTDVWK